MTNAPRSAEPTFPIQINELSLYDPPLISLGHKDRFYVEVGIDNDVQTTSTVGKHKLPWKESLGFDARQSSVITLRVFAERKLHQDAYVGSVQGRLDAFLGTSGKAVLHDVSPPPSNSDPHAAWKTKMSLSVKRVGEKENSMINAPRLAEPTFPIQINELNLYDPPSICSGHEDWYYMEVGIDNVARSTSAVCKHKLPWKETFTFNARQSSRMTLRVFIKRIHCRNTYIGSLQGTLGTFLGSSAKAVLHDISPPHSDNGHHIAWKPKISFSVKCVGDVTESGFPSVASFAPTIAVLDCVKTFSPLLDKINLFLGFANALGDIHPYVKIAAVILTGVVKVLAVQVVFKDHIEKLVHTMVDTHSFLTELDPLARIDSHLRIIRALSAQTVECSYFLQDITKDGLGFFRSQRLWATNTERKFREYTQKFQRLRASLQEHAIISTEVTVLRLYDEVQGISAQISLDNMHYAEDVHYTNVNVCNSLEPHWRKLCDEITSWIIGDSTERIFYLCGPAECGKTAIAHEVARLFDGLQRLESSYFVHTPPHHHYQPHPKDPRDPSCIFRNISRDIADHNPHFKQAVGEKVKICAIRTTSHIGTQFEELILGPAKQISWCGPVVIVIDALDVCTKGDRTNDLLNVLATRAAELPPNFRILVTSRPEADIALALKDKPHVMTKILKDATLPDNDSGVSFSPIATCGRRSPSVGDGVLESD